MECRRFSSASVCDANLSTVCGIDVWEMIICGIIEGVTLGVGFVCEKWLFDVLVEVCGLVFLKKGKSNIV